MEDPTDEESIYVNKRNISKFLKKNLTRLPGTKITIPLALLITPTPP